jgi:hypothetical protein
MPASPKITAFVMENRDVALAALAATPGLVAFAVKTKLWDKLSPTEKTECELLDADMPSGWWWSVRHMAPSAAALRWRHGKRDEIHPGYSVGLNGMALEVTTPMLDEETGELI